MRLFSWWRKGPGADSITTAAAAVRTWTIDYRTGGSFSATSPSEDESAPTTLWGFAPTARTAAQLVTSNFPD
jgi:hypothetical protein